MEGRCGSLRRAAPFHSVRIDEAAAAAENWQPRRLRAAGREPVDRAVHRVAAATEEGNYGNMEFQRFAGIFFRRTH
ncbi:MAG: hypothetical protein HFG34_02700 [Eubacterium sp.]|nr:hypothetical protein [Eubacterium sp.]